MISLIRTSINLIRVRKIIILNIEYLEVFI